MVSLGWLNMAFNMFGNVCNHFQNYPVSDLAVIIPAILIPANAMLNEDGTPMRNEDGTIMLNV
jgi:hypothetical protein